MVSDDDGEEDPDDPVNQDDEADGDEAWPGDQPRSPIIFDPTYQQALNMLANQVTSLQQQVSALQETQQADRQLFLSQFQILNANVRRIAVHPAHVIHHGLSQQQERQQQQSAPNIMPELGKPKNLYELWQEWEHGLGGCKPAKYFSSTEKGGVNKDRYFLRK